MRGALAAALVGAAFSLQSQQPAAVLINLPRHVERLSKVTAQLSTQGVDFELVEAVDGAALTRAELESNVTALGRLLLTNGMIGCFLSHRRCWQRCVALDKPLLVFEDDVELVPEFREQVDAAMSELPADWDVLLIGALGAVHPDKRYGLNLPVALVAGGMRRPRRLSERLHVPLRPMGTHCYLISPRGAAALLACLPRACFHVDAAAWGRREISLLATHPMLARQSHEDSTIGGAQWHLPAITADEYTGVSFGWAWCEPLVQLNVLGLRLLLTNGRAIIGMLIGLIAARLMRSVAVLGGTGVYVVGVVLLVRLLTYGPFGEARAAGAGTTAPIATA